MGRECSDTFNQGTDGELIECVEKSGFCDNILFPHSASASLDFSNKNSQRQLQPCPFQRCFFPGTFFPRNLQTSEDAGVGVGWELLPAEPSSHQSFLHLLLSLTKAGGGQEAGELTVEH